MHRYIRASGTLAASALILGACGGGHGNGTANPATYTVGGTVGGLVSGESLVLQDNGADNLSIFQNGAFAFAQPLDQGATFDVSILTQPQDEICQLSDASGTVAGANVQQVVVKCIPRGHVAVGGSVAGLPARSTIVIQDDGADSTTISANGAFTFSAAIASGTPYAVSILSEPAGQNCSVTNGSGITGTQAVTSILVACGSSSYNVGGTVAGLPGGARLTLLDNGGDRLNVGNGPFIFNTPVASGSGYAASLASVPSGQDCTLSQASGTVAAANVTTIAVNCAPLTFAIGGTVSGLASGTSVVLQDNGTDTTTVAANGPFNFAVPVASGAGYAVTVLASPTATQCTVGAGSGVVAAATVANVGVTCGSPSFDVAASVSNLAGAGLVLQDNGGDNLPITQSGLADFDTPLAGGAPYRVTVLSQPGGQSCTVSGGSGTIGTGNVTVAVACANLTGVWAWMGGSSLVDAAGVAGAGAGVPGGRDLASTWSDHVGDAWVFGGYGYGTGGAVGNLNDLWKFSGGQWTLLAGSGNPGAAGIYGSLGSAAAGNAPGARQGAATWFDAAGALWLFGGSGLDAQGNFGYLADLWKYSGGLWTWMGGTGSLGTAGVYGTSGVGAAANLPGGRQGAATWTDGSGDFWLFGGNGVDAAGNIGMLGDLWVYSAGQWTWIAGPDVAGAAGSYGVEVGATAASQPGGRFNAGAWADASGNLWLFGGVGMDAQGRYGYLNDLWKYSAGQWTWMSGSSAINAPGSYGSLGTASAGAVPGAREGASAWIDAGGRLWLFGGAGYDSAGKNGVLNDLWRYDSGQWTWVGGSDVQGAHGSNGSPGIASAGNQPGARSNAVAWVGAGGQLWMLGGIGADSVGEVGYLDDLWRYSP
jgi:N-acetylneuraminic acid mutarotase